MALAPAARPARAGRVRFRAETAGQACRRVPDRGRQSPSSLGRGRPWHVWRPLASPGDESRSGSSQRVGSSRDPYARRTGGSARADTGATRVVRGPLATRVEAEGRPVVPLPVSMANEAVELTAADRVAQAEVEGDP